jgi:polysaccharide pyruvyl transferase WcaK-like protein
LIIGGGNLLMDLFPIWPSRLYLISRKFYRAGLPVAFAGVGAFPIRTRLGRIFIKETVRKADLVFVRDRKTQEFLINTWKIQAQSHPDFALSYPVRKGRFSGMREDMAVAVNFAPVYSKWWPYPDEKIYIRFIDKFSKSLFDYFLSTNSNTSFWFYDTNYSDRVGTEELISRLLKMGIPESHICYEKQIFTSQEVVQQLSTKQFAVTTRLHAGLLAIRTGIPTIAIVYQPKVRDVLINIGLRKGIIDIHNIGEINTLFDEVRVDGRDFCLSPEQLTELDRSNRDVVDKVLNRILVSTY